MDADRLYELYRAGQWVQIFTAAFVGAWALGAHRVQELRGRALWVCTAVAYAVVVANLITASVLVGRYNWEFPDLHMLYEFSGLVAIGIIYSYGKQLPGRKYLIYGFGGLFLMGLAIRNVFMLS
jgi:hypothetical protein